MQHIDRAEATDSFENNIKYIEKYHGGEVCPPKHLIEAERKREEQQEEDAHVDVQNNANEDQKSDKQDKLQELFDRYKIKSKFIAIYNELCPSNLFQSQGIAQDISHLLSKCYEIYFKYNTKYRINTLYLILAPRC